MTPITTEHDPLSMDVIFPLGPLFMVPGTTFTDHIFRFDITVCKMAFVIAFVVLTSYCQIMTVIGDKYPTQHSENMEPAVGGGRQGIRGGQSWPRQGGELARG